MRAAGILIFITTFHRIARVYHFLLKAAHTASPAAQAAITEILLRCFMFSPFRDLLLCRDKEKPPASLAHRGRITAVPPQLRKTVSLSAVTGLPVRASRITVRRAALGGNSRCAPCCLAPCGSSLKGFCTGYFVPVIAFRYSNLIKAGLQGRE